MGDVQLKSGEIIVCRHPVRVLVVLGSSVAVSLYDRRLRLGAVCHYASSLLECSTEKETTRKVEDDPRSYAETSIPMMLEKLKKLGSRVEDLCSKIVAGRFSELGEADMRAGEKMLNRLGIQIEARVAGDRLGMKVRFYSETGQMEIQRPRRTQELPLPSGWRRRVFVVDDSPKVRELLTTILQKDDALEVVGVASGPVEAESMIAGLKPDVLILNLQMTGMGGLGFLEKLFRKSWIPVVIMSPVSKQESKLVLQALELGAVDCIQKPPLQELNSVGEIIRTKVKSAARTHFGLREVLPAKEIGGSAVRRDPDTTLIGIGSSTGGTNAVADILTVLPPEIPPILIVQHILLEFAAPWALRLDRLCPFEVRLAKNGDDIQPGRVLIAPGGSQMTVKADGSKLQVRVADDPLFGGHKPSIDVLFSSLASLSGKELVGVLLTGMGKDGAKGLLELKESGASTLAQDEKSCVVYGMPKAALELGAVEVCYPLHEIPDRMMQHESLHTGKRIVKSKFNLEPGQAD